MSENLSEARFGGVVDHIAVRCEDLARDVNRISALWTEGLSATRRTSA